MTINYFTVIIVITKNFNFYITCSIFRELHSNISVLTYNNILSRDIHMWISLGNIKCCYSSVSYIVDIPIIECPNNFLPNTRRSSIESGYTINNISSLLNTINIEFYLTSGIYCNSSG